MMFFSPPSLYWVTASSSLLDHKTTKQHTAKAQVCSKGLWERVAEISPASTSDSDVYTQHKWRTNCSFSLRASGLFSWELHTKLKWCREAPAVKKEAHSLLFPSRCLCLERGHPQMSHRSLQAGSLRPERNSARRHPRHPTNKSYQFSDYGWVPITQEGGSPQTLGGVYSLLWWLFSYSLRQGQWRPCRKLHLPMHHIVCQELLGINKGSFGAWPHCSFLSPGHSWVNSVQCCMMKKERKEGRYQSEWVKTGIHNCYFGCYHKLLYLKFQ